MRISARSRPKTGLPRPSGRPVPIEIGFRITTYILPSFSVGRRHLDGWLQLRRLPFCVLAGSHSMIWASANQRNLVAISRPNVSCADTLAIYLHSARVVSDRSRDYEHRFSFRASEKCGSVRPRGLERPWQGLPSAPAPALWHNLLPNHHWRASSDCEINHVRGIAVPVERCD